MASTVVDGLVIPVSLAGHPVLDFCNTRAAWTAPVPKEYLRSHAHLTVWAGANGLVPPAEVAGLRRAGERSAGAGMAVVDRAVRFRSALYALLVGPAGAADWATVNTEIRHAGAAVRLDPDPGAALVLHGALRQPGQGPPARPTGPRPAARVTCRACSRPTTSATVMCRPGPGWPARSPWRPLPRRGWGRCRVAGRCAWPRPPTAGWPRSPVGCGPRCASPGGSGSPSRTWTGRSPPGSRSW